MKIDIHSYGEKKVDNIMRKAMKVWTWYKMYVSIGTYLLNTYAAVDVL